MERPKVDQFQTKQLISSVYIHFTNVHVLHGVGSREKIRPERELERAKAQILQFQLGIRDAIQQLDSLGLQGAMKGCVFDSDGQIHHKDVSLVHTAIYIVCYPYTLDMNLI